MTTNPSRTLTIEQAWMRDIRRRFAELNRNIKLQLRRGSGSLVTNALDMSVDQQRIFMAWLESEIDRLFFTTDWQEQYQLASYMRSLKRVRADLIRAGEDITLTTDEIDFARASDFDFSATPSLFTQSAPDQPIHQQALEFLFTRSYEKLKTAAASMASSIRTTLFDGVQLGQGIVEITRNILKRTKITEHNAQRIARTETIQAYQRSTINEAERAQAETGKTYKLVWITARDERVRKLHAKWHGTVATQKRTREKIEISPWNCRCAQRVVTESMLTEAKKAKWKQERLAIMLLAA